MYYFGCDANVNQVVALPGVDPTDLLNATNLSPVTFQFGLSACDGSYTTAAVILRGTNVAADVTDFTFVIANTGTAINIGIGIIGGTWVSSFLGGPCVWVP